MPKFKNYSQKIIQQLVDRVLEEHKSLQNTNCRTNYFITQCLNIIQAFVSHQEIKLEEDMSANEHIINLMYLLFQAQTIEFDYLIMMIGVTILETAVGRNKVLDTLLQTYDLILKKNKYDIGSVFELFYALAKYQRSTLLEYQSDSIL